jgi:tape measure domain-containing protein
MVDESIIISVNDRIAPSIAVNFKKIASNAAMAGAAVDQFKAKLAAIGAGNFAAITAGLRGVTAEIMAQSTALDLLAKKQALLGSSFGGAIDVFNVDNIRQSMAQLTLMNSLLSTTAINTAKITAEAAAMAAAYGAAAAAAAKIKPSAIPSGGAGSIGRDMRDATSETNRFNQSQRDMLSLMSGSGGTAAATRLLAGGFGMVGAAAAVSAIAVAKLSDTYIIVNAQTANATSNALEASIAVDSLRKIAADTGAPLKDLARSFGRFNYALAENNVPMSRTLEMTQTITNALKMNGATTQEASSAMLQFSQALGKGYMNGDEFRNMMETMPMVARQVASSMGIAFGQLKDAASAGKVTWDVLLDAITDPAFQDEMKRKADAVQLFQYSWQSFVDKVTYSIGQFDKLTGTSSMVKGALDLMGDGAASAGEKLEALDNTFQALSISSSNAISRLSAQFPALQSAVNSFNSNGFVDELKKMADYASSPMMANVFKLLSIGLSGVTKIGDDFATRKTAMSTLMPGYSMTGETKSTEIPKFGMSKPVEMNMDMIVRDKRLAELVKAYQSYELKQSEFESKFNDIVYGKSGSGKKSSGGSTAINGAILDAQEAQKKIASQERISEAKAAHTRAVAEAKTVAAREKLGSVAKNQLESLRRRKSTIDDSINRAMPEIDSASALNTYTLSSPTCISNLSVGGLAIFTMLLT